MTELQKPKKGSKNMSTPMQKGTYIGSIQKVAFTESKNKGTPGFVCKFTIHTYASDGQWVAIEPQTRTVEIWVTDKTMPYAKHKLSQIGVEGDPKIETDASTGEDLLVLPPGASDYQVELICDHNEKGYDEFEFKNSSPGAKAAKPASQNAKMVLKALWSK